MVDKKLYDAFMNKYPNGHIEKHESKLLLKEAYMVIFDVNERDFFGSQSRRIISADALWEMLK